MLIYFYKLFLLPFSQILDLMLTLVLPILQYTVDEAYDSALISSVFLYPQVTHSGMTKCDREGHLNMTAVMIVMHGAYTHKARSASYLTCIQKQKSKEQMLKFNCV